MFPFGGGGYFVSFQNPLHLMVQQMNRRQIPATLYLHPREIDPAQPRMDDLPWSKTQVLRNKSDGREAESAAEEESLSEHERLP